MISPGYSGIKRIDEIPFLAARYRKRVAEGVDEESAGRRIESAYIKFGEPTLVAVLPTGDAAEEAQEISIGSAGAAGASDACQ